MKKKSLFELFILRLIRTLLFMFLLVLVGVVSYKITMFYYKVTDRPTNAKIDSIIRDIVNNGKVEDISKNLIYSVNEDTGIVENMVIEIFNSHTGNLDYITIPAKTQFTISNDRYQRICESNPEIPQIIEFTNLKKYFGKTWAYDYGVLLVEDLLNIDVSYYTVVKSDTFNQMFEPINSNDNASENNAIPILTYTDKYRKELSNLNTKEDIEDYIKDLYKKIDSNLKLKQKLKYVENYSKISMDSIYFYGVYGENDKDLFIVDTKATNELIQEILDNDSYQEPQEDITDSMNQSATSSVGLKIQILNGSQITGLAAKYNEKLTLSGYTIVNVDNYNEEVLTHSKIITRADGTGLDLLSNFKNAEITTGELPEGIDIRIILGTEDDITK